MKTKARKKYIPIKPKYTPGPWIVNPTKAKNIYDRCIVAPLSGEQAIDCFQSGSSAQESVANAQLIAAAPDMLEALKQYIGLHPAGYCSHGAECFHCETRRKKTEAIVCKALGEAKND